MSNFRALAENGGDIISSLTLMGRVFYASDSAQNATITGQTSFATTTPSLMIDVPSGTTCIPLGVRLQQTGTVAGGAITVIVEADNADRYNTGGTSETIFNARTGTTLASTAAPLCTVYSGATATDAYGIRLDAWNVGADVDTAEGVDNGIVWAPDGPILLEGPAAFLVYTYAASTGPTWFWTMKFAEIPTNWLN